MRRHLAVVLLAGVTVAMSWSARPASDAAPPTRVVPAPSDAAGAEDAAVHAGFALQVGGVTARLRIVTVTAVPEERVKVSVVGGRGEAYEAAADAGALASPTAGTWVWTVPSRTGLYRMVVIGAPRDSVTLNVFVGVPAGHIQNERLNGYRIGRYLAPPPRAIYATPKAFIEVTPQLLETPVSPRFRLKQFVCKQAGGYPKYLVLDTRLLLKLEYLLDVVNAAGYRVSTFGVLSGYRTPYYNRAIGNVVYSRHVWGAAADVYVDNDGDGIMDDLNGDGRVDVHDADVLYRLVDRQVGRPEYEPFIGGLGKYPVTANHGPFVHVDLRDRRARW